MQFNRDTYQSGDPTLVGHTRFLAGDPDASTRPDNLASTPMFSTDEVKDAVNFAYEELWEVAQRLDVGWGEKIGYITSVTDQILYDLPTDIDGRVIDVAIELDGKDLSSDSTAKWTYLTPSEENIALRGYREGTFTNTEFVFLLGGKSTYNDGADPQQFGIVAPPDTGGSNSICLVYEASLTKLSADGDIPAAPVAHHQLICYLAAITLKASKELPVDHLRAEAARKYPLFVEAMGQPIQDLEGQMTAVGRIRQTFSTATGRISRS